MLEPHTASLLIDYYEAFLRDQDLDHFRQKVTARYTEGTLGRLLQTGTATARRAAVLALGLVGTMETNATVARALRDDDVTVRSLAENALWTIWFRADSAENNETLENVRELIIRGKLAEAETLANHLISRAPRFAEAYNQRAIIAFSEGRFAASAEDCRRTLDRNPYHIGALAGLARCYLQLEMRADALATFRRAYKLQPYNNALREAITTLEALLDRK